MRMVIQRVSEASVSIEGQLQGQIGRGLLVFLGIHQQDSLKEIGWLVDKLLNIRVFGDENGKMNLSVLDTQSEILVVSQFTLYANINGGRRPDFFDAAPPSIAEPLYLKFVEEVQQKLGKVQTGRFGADMRVSLVNEGPVTLIVDSRES